MNINVKQYFLEIEQETCRYACGERAICKVTTNGEAECSCPDGLSGDPTVSCSKCPQVTTTACPGWLEVEGTSKYDGLYCKIDQSAHDSPVYDGPGNYAMSK